MIGTPAAMLGAIFILLGALGFISNPLIGADALFVADTTHNLIHLVVGMLLLAVSRAGERSVPWLKTVGALLFLFGLGSILLAPSPTGSLFGIVLTNNYSDWFHLITGIILFVGAF